jgi:hypothetical protein
MIKQGNKRLTTKRRTGWLWLAGSLVCLLTLGAGAQTNPDSLVNRCGVTDHERILQQRNPDRLRQLNELNNQIDQYLEKQKSLRQPAVNVVYRIPIVVHVVHNNASNTIGGANNVNISDAQILSQIQVLNEDYRRQPGTNGYNTSPIGADAGIEFYLASVDPNGQPTTGITRHYYAQKSSFSIFNDDLLLSQIAYWPSDRYLNIWVASIQDNYLGYTQFPTATDTLKGLPSPSMVNNMTDGSIIDYRVFGRQIGTVNRSLYLLGRTVTHEIGHWLGLIHPWGDANCGNDYVADTPLMTDGSTAQQSCRQTFSNCDGKGQVRDLMENYMNYWPDACMNMFTAGQVARMRAVLVLNARRAKIVSTSASLPESENLTIAVYPNPASSDPSVDVQLKGAQSFSVGLLDMAGRQLRTLSYTDVPSTRLVLPVNGLAPGLYIVRVKTGSETVSKRLLVQ